MDGERKVDLGTTVGGDLDVVTALMQVAAEMDGMGLHAAKAGREFGQDEQEPRNALPEPGNLHPPHSIRCAEIRINLY